MDTQDTATLTDQKRWLIERLDLGFKFYLSEKLARNHGATVAWTQNVEHATRYDTALDAHKKMTMLPHEDQQGVKVVPHG